MDKKLVLFILIFFFVLLAFSTSVFLSTTSRKIRATQQITSQTLCITSALSAEIGESVKITCVARDENTDTVANTECCFTSSLGEIQPRCGNTDKYGKTTSVLISREKGISEIVCTAGESITSNTSVQFN